MITIKNKNKCCGCSACSQKCPLQCIKMEEDKQGFLYPLVDLNACVDCGLCEKVCPVINQTIPVKPHIILACKSKNNEIRKNSSSGGFFSMIAEKFIKEGGVVFGARFDENWEVIHDYTESINGIEQFRCS